MGETLDMANATANSNVLTFGGGWASTLRIDAVRATAGAKITNDPAHALGILGVELAGEQRAAHGDATALSVVIEGKPRELNPTLRDEIDRIAGEALRNAFRHARARRIEVEIRYGARQLRVRVRDDGIGIDAAILNQARRAGHWGLPGMREGAKRIGARLELWSEHGAGTEVELTIPAGGRLHGYLGASS